MVLKCICYNMFLLCIYACYIVYEHVTKRLENQYNCAADDNEVAYSISSFNMYIKLMKKPPIQNR